MNPTWNYFRILKYIKQIDAAKEDLKRAPDSRQAIKWLSAQLVAPTPQQVHERKMIGDFGRVIKAYRYKPPQNGRTSSKMIKKV